MKITEFGLVFVIIFLPSFVIFGYHVNDQQHVNRLLVQYSTALRTATQDAAKSLDINEMQEYESKYESLKSFKADKDSALNSFLHTLYLNFGISEDSSAQEALLRFIPALIVIDYDGYYIYAASEYVNDNGETIISHEWSPKKPYAYADRDGNSVQFTLDSYVTAYGANNQTWYHGFQHEIQGTNTIPLLQDADTFDHVRRSTIVTSIQNDLAYYINKHNEYASRVGVTYEFTLPTISQEEWNNSIDDIGIIAFIQGMPVGDQYLNNYALGSGRLVKKPVIYGAVDDATGLKYYYPDSCKFSYRVEQAFSSKKEAAAQGYYERSCTNQ
ncbi:hypothetical protein PASE110613_00620 [Paenibacillus sediminis]|uniref:F0F1-type ATP synthase n=1 Tax=Paenibacillus sediminis TaxID=664909 RepID=A0ABS4H0D7_9BACL|nr:hypothetical protein [Paenibacillus sediminis]MBP1935916.1 hypothetical protein [Paenibacillus sediminis]